MASGTRVEPVANPRLGCQVTRRRRIGFELLPQLPDEDAQIFWMLLPRLTPYGVKQPAVFDDAVGPPGKVHEKIEFLGCESDFAAADVYAACPKVDAELAHFKRRRVACFVARAPQRGAHARKQ